MRINIFGDTTLPSVSDMKIDDCLRNVLKGGDYNVINFEAPIKTNAKPSLKSGPSLCQDASAPKWLVEHGFNIFSLANNHIMDYGEVGLTATMEAISRAGGKYVGCGSWEDAYRPIVLIDGELKVSILSVAELQFGILHDIWTQKGQMGGAWINHESIDDIVSDTKENSDYVIVIAHAGLEGLDVPLPEWRDRYRRLVDCGADCVIGGHTHIMQGMETYKGKQIFYSGGNFMFSKSHNMPEHWWKGYGVQLNLSPERLEYSVFGTLYDNKTAKLDDSLCINSLGGGKY